MQASKLILITYILIMMALGLELCAEDDYVLVAVGKAQREEKYVGILGSEFSKDDSVLKSYADQYESVLISDFSFYKKKFFLKKIPEDMLKSSTDIQYEKFQERGYSHLIGTKLEKEGSNFRVSAYLYDVAKKSIAFEINRGCSANIIRECAHDLNNEIYKALENKDSIFKSSIVFVSDMGTATKNSKQVIKELFIMDFDGHNTRRLTYLSGIVVSPAVSPDGTKIVFSYISNKISAGRRVLLYEYDLMTKQTRLISRLPGVNSGAVYTGLGRSIYLTLSYGGNAEIYEMDLATGKRRKVTNHWAIDVDPSVTADGTLMTFLSGRAGSAMIYTMDPRGTERGTRRISFVGKYNASPRFSPDGQEIVFASWIDNGFDLFRISATGNTLVRLTKDYGSNEDPSYSPDGEFITFSSAQIRRGKSISNDIVVMDREGMLIGKLTNGFGRCYSPRWSNRVNVGQ